MPTAKASPKTKAILTPVAVPLDSVSSALCSAFEGGSNYWYRIERFIKPRSFVNTPKLKVYRHLSYPLNRGGALIVSDSDGAGEGKVKTGRLDLASINRGLALMATLYPKHFSDLLREDADSTTGDVLLQLCLFGELIYC